MPLAIEQASAIIQDGIPIHEFLDHHKSKYQQLMAHKPRRSAWYYDKDTPVVTMLNVAVSRLDKNPDAADLLTFFSCFGPHMIAMDLLTEFWKSENIMQGHAHLDSSNSSKKVKWLKKIGQNLLTFRLAISRLDSLCLMKTRRDDQSGVTSASVHSTISKWRLETIHTQEREDCIMLAALVLSQSLPDISMDAAPDLKYIPLVKDSHDLMLQYIEPRSLEPPNGRLCQQFAAVSARYAQVYAQSVYTREAEAMVTAATTYESLQQGSSWPQDRRSLLILKLLADSLWKSKQFDKTVEVLETLCEESTRLFGDMDDIPVWAAARLRDARDMTNLHDQFQRRAVIATHGTKPPLRLDPASYAEDFHTAPEDHANPTSDDEYRLKQIVQESEEQFGPTDDDTLQAISDLAQFYEISGLYLKAGKSYEHLWDSYRSKRDNKHGSQALADAVDCYTKSDLLTQQLEFGSLKEGLIWAALYGNENLVATLTLAGANVNQQDVEGFTALHHAAWACDERTINHLLEKNADTNICTLGGFTPLHMLFLRERLKSMEHQQRVIRTAGILINAGADVDAGTKDGISVLRVSAARGVTAYVRFMLDNGCRCDETTQEPGKNFDNISALQMASARGFEEIVKLLLESGIYQHSVGSHPANA